MPAERGDPRLHALLALWVDSESKARLLVFYRNNPGVIESLEGLSRRLSLPEEVLMSEIRDHLELGILRERRVGDRTVFLVDRSRWGELESAVERAVADSSRRVASR